MTEPSQAAREALPYAYTCPAGCGCLWRDNGDESMSLFNGNQKSCSVCEFLPLDNLTPLFAIARETAALADNTGDALTLHILRAWDRGKLERFALHLLGDEWQELRAERDRLRAALDAEMEVSRARQQMVENCMGMLAARDDGLQACMASEIRLKAALEAIRDDESLQNVAGWYPSVQQARSALRAAPTRAQGESQNERR